MEETAQVAEAEAEKPVEAEEAARRRRGRGGAKVAKATTASGGRRADVRRPLMSNSKTEITMNKWLRSNLDQLWPRFGQNRPTLGDFCHMLTSIGQLSTSTWPETTNFGRHEVEVGQSLADFVQISSMLV